MESNSLRNKSNALSRRRIARAAWLAVFAFVPSGNAMLFSQTASGVPAATGSCTLIVHVTGVRNQKGVIGGALFTSSDGWPEDESKAFAHGPFPITGKTATLTFKHLPSGRYGVVVLHDENSNKKLDRNFLGIPKEGFGFANNPRVLLSAPSIDKAWVDVSCPATETTIALIYK